LTAIIDYGFLNFSPFSNAITLGASMYLAIQLEPIFQLTFVTLIMLAGPAVVLVLALRGGDL
jgi:hypothetical protein